MARYAIATTLSSWRQAQPQKRQGRRGGGKPTHSPSPARREPARPADRYARAWPKDAIRGEEEPHEAELDEADLGLGEEPVEGDLGEEVEGLGQRVRDAVTHHWQKPVALGPNLRIETRKGFRAAVIEVRPGLFVVAEVPVESVEFGFGPLLLAPALMRTLGRALQGRRSAGSADRQHRPELSTHPAPKQITGSVKDGDGEGTGGLARWLDSDIAAEIGCPTCMPTKRRSS